MSSCHTIPSLTHLLFTGVYHPDSGVAQARVPPQLMLFWEWDCRLCPLFPLSIHGYHHVYALCSSFIPSLLTLLNSFLFRPLFNSLSLSSPPLSPSLTSCLSELADDNDLQAFWTQLTLLLHSLALPLSLSFFSSSCYSSNSARSSRPGNEGSGHSVKHLLFNRALLPALHPIQEARGSTCWITEFRGFTWRLAGLCATEGAMTDMSASYAWH